MASIFNISFNIDTASYRLSYLKGYIYHLYKLVTAYRNIYTIPLLNNGSPLAVLLSIFICHFHLKTHFSFLFSYNLIYILEIEKYQRIIRFYFLLNTFLKRKKLRNIVPECNIAIYDYLFENCETPVL